MSGTVDNNEKAPQPTPSSLFSGKVPIEVALEELRLRLLDMTGRNRLVNFKHSPGKSLQFVHSSINSAFKRLIEPSGRLAISPLPEPDRSDWIHKNGRITKPEPKEWAASLGISTGYALTTGAAAPAAQGSPVTANELRTLYFAEDLGRHCRKLEREAKLALEETGANMLYLVAGFLEFPESPGSAKLYQAPMLCVPVAISRVDEGQYASFYLSYTGEEISDNLSLREKLRSDFGFNLPEFDPEGDEKAEDYLKRIAKAVERQPDWSVKPMLTLTLLSFANMLLVRDLEPTKWQQPGLFDSLLDHPLVKQVFEGKPSEGDTQYADEYSIDEHPKGDLPLIFDADSSQHSALIDVLEGHSRVIEGPPGTGKSQTITNLIAAGLHAGKKILFVAEKLAALEVVKSRLDQAKLAPFVLELHSNKTNKKRVLEDLAARMKLRITQTDELSDLMHRHQVKRQELKAYADLMNSRVGNQMDLTLHQVMWRSERHRLQARESAKAVHDIEYFSASRTSQVQFANTCDHLRHLATQLDLIGTYGPKHPLWGFFPSELSPEQDLAVQRVLRNYAERFNAFANAAQSAASLLGCMEFSLSEQGANQLLSTLDHIAPASADDVAFDSLPRLFTADDTSGRKSLLLLQNIQTQIARIGELSRQATLMLLSPEPTSDSIWEAANRIYEEATVFGFEDKSWTDLSETSTRLLNTAQLAQNALNKLQEAANSVGLTFTDQVSELTVLQVTTEVASTAPLEALSYRHEGLEAPLAIVKLRDGRAKAATFFETQAKADALLYLDVLPTENELTESVRTLREGDAWYRIFQGRWRKAKAVHRVLSRDKSKKSGADCLKDLELLVQLNSLRSELQNDDGIKEAAGAWFDVEKTPFDGLIQAAEWLTKARSSLDSLGARTTGISPLTVKRSELESLRKAASIVSSSVDALNKFQATSRAFLTCGQPRVLKAADSPAWTLRIETWEHAAKAAMAASAFAQSVFRPSVSLRHGLQALGASREVPQKEKLLEADEAAKSLLGARFNGVQTDLTPVLSAHTYGSLVKKANLSKEIESILISEKCADNYAQLRKYVEAINQGWQDNLDFGNAISPYGQFEPAQWADSSGKVGAVYASELAAKTKKAAESLGGLLAWTQYVAARKRAMELGLDGFIHGLETGTITSEHIVHAFTYRFYAAIAKSVFDQIPALKQFSGAKHSEVRKEFAELDKQIIQLRGWQVARTCKERSRPPAGNHGARVDDKTESKLLEHLIPQQRPRVPVRQIMRRAGKAIQELKPCFMMGPQAVAQFLEPGRLHFDIIVMDEASQLRPEQAIGAIARGSQLVVVGDPKQLPPTSFFSRMSATDGNDGDGLGQLATSDAESILDVCMSHFRPVRTLRWHYRSRHESLIAFSNQHFYGGKLVVFPSPYPKGRSLGLSYHYVQDGNYENQMNHVEAKRVVDAVVDHILHRPHDSLGVVTLNIKQRDLVAELLEERIRSLPSAAEFRETWEAQGMGLFIKNLENVQGDERDCILISTTFGKAKGTDVVRQNFGPISREGGWRRLNVLFTRARKSVAVFSSMRPEDIVSDNRTPEGTRALRNYLEFASTGVLSSNQETGLPPDSDFEVAVMDVLRGKGYEVTPQLGVAGFRIDIAVRHPDQLSGYLAAIECDGASYHSGVSVRDRDRIRQEILESLGWHGRIWRIWSTDWFRNPLAETDRLLQFLESIRKAPLPWEDLYAPDAESEANNVIQPQPTEVTASPAAVVKGNRELELVVAGADAATLLVFDEDDDLEVEVGDLVTYAPVDTLDMPETVCLTANQTIQDMGLVAVTKPLGAILVGTTVGETVVLRVPGLPPKSFVIKEIKRPSR